MTLKVHLEPDRIDEQITLANDTGLPLLICLIATKACFVKFGGLVHSLHDARFPFLAIESGQHYETHLTTAADEMRYRELLSGYFHVRGDMIRKTRDLQECLADLHHTLTTSGLSSPALLVVCGDTLTAGVAPFAWYLLTGRRSVHVESGLRSMRPKWEWFRDLLDQRYMPWTSVPTRPFPEGMCTRMATVGSQQLMAPVQRNADTLISEGHDPGSIHVTGSPSVDALNLVRGQPYMPTGKRLRVDVHRRENLIRERLLAIFEGLQLLSALGIPIEFVITNSMRACEPKSWSDDDINKLRSNGIRISSQWDSYTEVVSFLSSDDCIGIYTDSGGLQEECCILGVKCMTCRFDTDRPETVTEFKTNVLIPPTNPSDIARHVHRCLTDNPKEIWPGLGESADVYGLKVGKTIVDCLKKATFEPATSNLLQ